MATLVRKWLLSAAQDGLLLRLGGVKDGGGSTIRVEYRTLKISSPSHPEDGNSNFIEVYGVVGILNLVSSSHLIVITRREQVAQIRGKSVYAVRDVVLIPLTSQSEAEKALNNAVASFKQQQKLSNDTDTELSDVGEDTDAGEDHALPETEAVEPPRGVLAKSTTFTKNVIHDRGLYGRFAERWFSKNGSNVNARRKQGISSEEDLTDTPLKQESDGNDKIKIPLESEDSQSDVHSHESTPKKPSAIESLSGRVQRTARMYFSTSGFYFSYDLDLSRRAGQDSIPDSAIPLWKQFDPLYLWNANLIKPFINAGRNELVLPLMQGFIGQRAVSIFQTEGDQNDSIEDAAEVTPNIAQEPSSTSDPDNSVTNSKTKDFLLTLVSRRSVKRAGLRYLRRGVDDDGSVANDVETEQILSSTTWNSADKKFSLTQVRGSIPLHFTQSPYSFKPTSVIQGSESTNQTALKKHFASMSTRYAKIQAVSLVDKHGPENNIGQLYEDHVKRLNENGGVNGNQVGFEWFDFHKECKGMKFENVSILISTLESKLKSFAWTIETDARLAQQQSGILRTNCMDCLDRTNVVQSAVAGWALEQQLAEFGLNIDLKSDPKTQWFNSVWADNGDAISRQYAGTAALKGDFTRTRKRNWTGALSDFSLTLNRYYRNIFGDYFLQTCIDYFLGNANPAVFDEFETDMMAKDYALDMGRIRQNAIDTSVKIVLDDSDEDLIDGWTLSCPHEANTLRSLPFEECVVLLTNVAFYFCRFDWATEKVASFERVLLPDILEIWRGPYITNAFGNNLDETKNVGLAFRYKPAENFMVRRNTRTLQTDEDTSKENAERSELEKQKEPEKDRSRLLAFKALPAKSAAENKSGEAENMSEVEFVKHICEKLHTAMESAIGIEQAENGEVPKVEERAIISAADAKKNTGYAESIGYSLKKLVWS